MFARFKQEAKAAGNFSHQYIVSVWDYGEIEGDAFIAMELIKGKDLKYYIDNNIPLEFNEIIWIMIQLLEALDYSHDRASFTGI